MIFAASLLAVQQCAMLRRRLRLRASVSMYARYSIFSQRQSGFIDAQL